MKLIAEDMISPPCGCPECFQAGVSEKDQRRDPQTGAWMHGESLRRWYEARENFLKLKSQHGPKDLTKVGRR